MLAANPNRCLHISPCDNQTITSRKLHNYQTEVRLDNSDTWRVKVFGVDDSCQFCRSGFTDNPGLDDIGYRRQQG